jgi:hypothetical protein
MRLGGHSLELLGPSNLVNEYLFVQYFAFGGDRLAVCHSEFLNATNGTDHRKEQCSDY